MENVVVVGNKNILLPSCHNEGRAVDGKVTVVPGVDDCGSPAIQDGGQGSTTSTDTEKHSELLKLAEGDRERAQDSVQYPAPGKHHQKLVAMERPQSVPQKAVHFQDDEPKAEDRVVPRSKSAHPRITGRVRGNSREGSSKENGGRRSGSGRGRKIVATECRDESLIDERGGDDKDRDDEQGDGSGGGSTGTSKEVGSLPGGEGNGSGGGTDSGVSDNRGGQGKQQSLGLQKDIVIRASIGGYNARRGSQLIGDARGVLVVVSKTVPSRGKCQTRSSDGKPRNNKQMSRNIRAKTAGSAARRNVDVIRSQRPHTAHGSSLNLDLEFTRDPKEEIVAHGDVCFVGSDLAATRTKTAGQPVVKTTKHSGDNITDVLSENIKVGLCSGCSKVSMLIKAGAVANGRQELCCNCLLKVDVAKAQTLETSDVREKENLRNAIGKDKHKIDSHSEATAELTSNDSDYGSNSDENAFMTCFNELEASMLLARQEIRAEMAETNTDLCLVPIDKDIGDESESDHSEGSFNESSDEGTGDEVVEILARCFDECISITGSVGAISEYLTNVEYYKSMKAKQYGSEIAPIHKVQSKQSGQSSAKTSERSESLGKDVRSGDVTNYEVMLMKGYSANVDVPADDAESDTPFLELMCRCLPEPAKVRNDGDILKLTLEMP